MFLSGARKAAVAAILAGIAAAAAPPAVAAEPRLVDQYGHAFTLSSLRGRPLIVTFVAARCTEACPLINGKFAQTQQLFAHDHTDAMLLTITMEPEHDTVKVMNGLAQRFGAKRDRWILATGAPRDVHALLRVFGVRTGDDHTTFVYVFDRNGVFRDRIFASSALERQLTGELHAIAGRERAR